jgi:hypothetical protein
MNTKKDRNGIDSENAKILLSILAATGWVHSLNGKTPYPVCIPMCQAFVHIPFLLAQTEMNKLSKPGNQGNKAACLFHYQAAKGKWMVANLAYARKHTLATENAASEKEDETDMCRNMLAADSLVDIISRTWLQKN